MAFTLKTPNAPMSFKQGLKIRNLGGGDVRGENLTMKQASDRIAELMAQSGDSVERVKKTKPNRDEEFQALYNRAHQAGLDAGLAANPVPMIVAQHANPLDDQSPVQRAWKVDDGACGFAWVIVRPANSAFAKWLVEHNLASKRSSGPGVMIWVREYNQSVTRKDAHAYAMAKVLKEAGLDAYSDSRLD